jgi:hypothetical protein
MTERVSEKPKQNKAKTEAAKAFTLRTSDEIAEAVSTSPLPMDSAMNFVDALGKPNVEAN